jgi:hypothetical protein
MLNFPQSIEVLSQKFNLRTCQVKVNWPYQTLSKTTILPFDTPNISENPSWFKAYNKLKHDRNVNQVYGNLENCLTALSALFILNLLLRKDEIWESSKSLVTENAREKLGTYSKFFSSDSILSLYVPTKEKPGLYKRVEVII